MSIESFYFDNLEKESNKIVDAVEKTGFVRIQFSNDMNFNKVYQATKKFFNLRQEAKNESEKNKNDMLYYGYFPSNLDGKEGLDIPNILLKNKCYILANQICWPTEFDKEQINHIYEYFSIVHDLAKRLLNILYPNLDTSSNIIDEKNMSMLRLNYYPKHNRSDVPICDQDEVKLSCESHTDCSLITILFQDDVGGLQIMDPITKKWIDVECIENSLIVNTGKLLGIISNNKYIPVYHRVLFNIDERISIPYFMYPNYDTIINENMTCGDYLISALKLFKEYDYIFDMIRTNNQKEN